MGVSNLVSWRYMTTSRENRFFSWISVLSIAGIAIGIAAMIVVISVFTGFERELRDRFLAANAHILMYRFPSGLSDPDLWEEDIQSQYGSALTGTSPFVHNETMSKKNHVVQSILVKGILPNKRQKVQDLQRFVYPPSSLEKLQDEVDAFQSKGTIPEVPSIIVGRGLLFVWNAKVGEQVDLISPTQSEGDPFGDRGTFQIVGVYDSGFEHYDNKIGIVSLPAAKNLFKMGNRVTGIEVGLKDPDQSKQVAAQMMDQYDQLSINEWQSFNKSFLLRVQDDRQKIAFIVALVAIVASFNILTTLFVLVSQKQRDISILRALGASGRLILRIFLKQGFLFGVIGAGFGMVLALLISLLLSHYPIVELPKVYPLSTLPVEMDWQIYGIVSSVGIFFCIMAGVYPALMATRVNPTEALVQGRRN